MSQFDSSRAADASGMMITCHEPLQTSLAMPLRINSTHDFSERGLDAYFTCPEAIRSLIALEGPRLPRRIWEPAAGDGAIVRELIASGRQVVASDVQDYGLADCRILDYLTAPRMVGVNGIVTNPPYRRAMEFAMKAIAEVPYVALLTRLNFDAEGVSRMPFRQRHPPTRIWKSAQRFPMMHRHGYAGKKSTSNVGYWWLVWQHDAPREFPEDYDWKELLSAQLRLAV